MISNTIPKKLELWWQDKRGIKNEFKSKKEENKSQESIIQG